MTHIVTELCPSCGRPVVMRCGCPVNEARCANGHQWYREQGGVLTVARGFGGWSHASDKHQVEPPPTKEADWHALAVELAAATHYYLKALKLRCEVSRVSECGECATCQMWAAVRRIEAGAPSRLATELDQARAERDQARATLKELAQGVLKFADQA